MIEEAPLPQAVERRAAPLPAVRSTNTRRAIVQFAAAGLMTLVVVAVLGALVGRDAAKHEAFNDAKRTCATLANAIIIPNLSDDLIAGRPDAVRRMDAAIVGRIIPGVLVRAKIWTPDGRVVYSDEHRLIGDRFPLRDNEREALRDRKADVYLTDLTKPENRFERGHGKLLEVYRPIQAPSGRMLLFETYSSYDTVTRHEHEIWTQFAPITFGMLIILQFVQLPLARRMARRLDASQRERERLMRDALATSDATRRRIAGDLHDGIVQDLVAVSYTLSGSAARAGRDDHARVLHEAAATVRRGISALRSLLAEIYPPGLHTAGLAAALADLVVSVSDRGLSVDSAIPDEITASPEAEELIYRSAQEILRNVVSHAGARQVDVALQRRGDLLVLTVADDGIGFDPATITDGRTPGHLGLRLLHDLAVDADAALEIDSTPGHGTRVRLEVPAS